MSASAHEACRKLSDQIHVLLFSPSPKENLERVREQFRAALEQHDRYEMAAKAWWRRWRAHFRRLEGEPRLRNPEAGPPERGWVWVERLDDTVRNAPHVCRGWTPEERVQEGELRALLLLRRLEERPLNGWFPPELADASKANLPPSPWPRLATVGDPPEVVLMRQYAIVALAHDTTDAALGRVRPRVLEGIGFPEPAYRVRWLMKGFEPDSIEEAIASVRQDLTLRASTPRSKTRCAVEAAPPRDLSSGPETVAGIMSKRKAKRNVPPGKQADTPPDKFTPFPVQTVETLENVENVALVLLHLYRPVLELQQEVRRVLDGCAESPETSAGRELKTQLILDAWERVSRAGWLLDGAERLPLADTEPFLRQAEGLHKNLNRTNLNLVRAARRLLPDVWERLEILPVGPPAKDLGAAERDWKRLIKAAGAERARQAPKGAGPAQEIVKICDEMLHLGREPGSGEGFIVTPHHPSKRPKRKGKAPLDAEAVPAVGSFRSRSGPSGFYGRMGMVLDDVWEALSAEFDGRAERLADLVKALDPAYDTRTFYSPDPVSVWVAYPKARKMLSEDDQRAVRKTLLALGDTEAKADAFLSLLDTWQEEQTSNMWTKMQWPGYVTEGSGRRIFLSKPALVHAFDRRFNALKNWAAERARQARDEEAAEGGQAEAREAKKWVKRLASEVSDLVRNSDIRKRFHEMMDQWQVRRHEQVERKREWKKRREQHFERLATLPQDDPQRTESTTPPEPGWVWEPECLVSSGGIRGFIEGWVPQDLAQSREPEIELILPLGERALRLDEKYTLLAAVHDSGLQGVDKIDPWETFAGIPYVALRHDLLRKIKGAENELRAFLEDVKQDADTPPNAADPELRRMEAADPVLSEPPQYHDTTWPGVFIEASGSIPVQWRAGTDSKWRADYTALAERAEDMASDRRESAARRKAARELAGLFKRYLAFGTPKKKGGWLALWGPEARKHLDEMDRVGSRMQALAVRRGFASASQPVYVPSATVRGLVLGDRLARQTQITKAWAAKGVRQKRDEKAAEDKPPLSEKQAAVLNLLRELPPERALTGEAILNTLAERDPSLNMDLSTLTRHIIPILKKHYGVKNKPRIGYYVSR